MRIKSTSEEEPFLSTSDPNANKGGFRTVPFIIANEAFERLASVGLMPNMILYLTRDYGMKTTEATNVLLLFTAASNFLPVLGAFLADSLVGRYPMIAFGSIASLLGMVLLWITTMIPKSSSACYNVSDTCSSPTAFELLPLHASFVLMAFGAGGIRSASLAFGVDQLTYRDKEERIKDSYFSWYYASTAVAALVALSAITYIQDQMGWKLGFGIPVVLMFISTLSFFLASPFYVKLDAKENLFSGLAQVLVASFKNRHLQHPQVDMTTIYHHGKDSKLVMPSDKLRFLNKACIIKDLSQDLTPDGRASNPWNLCTVDQVEELKVIFKVFPIWISGIMLAVGLSQNSFVVLEASSMDRHITSNFQIPAGSFDTFMLVSVVICIVFYDRVFVFMASRIMGRPTRVGVKLKMGLGMFSSCLAIASMAAVESIRRKTAVEQGYSEHPEAAVNISAMWLLPKEILDGIAEAFNPVGQNEFYLTEMPQSLSCMASSLVGLGTSAGSLVTSLILNLVDKFSSSGGNVSWLSSNINKGHYEYYYGLLCVLCLLNFVYYLYCSRAYGPCKGELNKVLDEGVD
ncbi:hypothetical protein QN277_015074 [Acacia crassicarpa]|uniref:Protein NRT1/ PTR FAMILY 1.2-like n=1 Tax=Acacia crassicarpa TaxID=499986 RepID=A0AAE1MTS4_9FABA|nr:hypothetical protein QN277_015074 [Acacia crassicarpa]